MNCRICSNPDAMVFLSLGKTTLANSFLPEKELGKKEPRFPLELCFCTKCSLVQLGHVVPPEKLFTNYLYVTSTSKTFQKHFTSMADKITHSLKLGKGSLVVDVGSNDGLLLKGFQCLGMKTVGIEPASNIAAIANNEGVETVNAFFDGKTVHDITSKYGKADVVTATNVFAHIPDINQVIVNVKALLKKSGTFVIEVQYLIDTIQTMTFDNVYHEHLYYYSLTSLNNLFERHSMEIFDVEHVDSHGGSLRVFVQCAGNRPIASAVGAMLAKEQKLGISTLELYQKFSKNVLAAKKAIVSYIQNLKSQGKSIAGYGAPAKSTTLLNFCGIAKEDVDYIVEDNPLKIGLYAPGTHIPIVSSAMLSQKIPDYILILAWNFSTEIMDKTKAYRAKGVKYIIPLPEPKTI